MKNKVTILVLIILICLLVGAIFIVPKIFPKNNTESSSNVSTESLDVSSVEVKTYTLSEMITESDNVVSGTVIKADVDENGVLYTLTVSWSDVLKGRNYATMGYAYVKGAQTLELNKTYLFIGDTSDEKYHYIEPFEKAPWVFEINDDETLNHISNGDTDLVTDFSKITLEEIKNICKNQVSSK